MKGERGVQMKQVKMKEERGVLRSLVRKIELK
jgi:hypothetical protein